MNFQCIPPLNPIRVMMIDPLSSGAQLLIPKILAGIVFGTRQLIDLILLCYTNEMSAASQYCQELRAGAFACFNSIKTTSDLPSIADADVFCYISGFRNPNILNFEDMGHLYIFDTLYLTLKIAISLGKKMPQTEETVKGKSQKPSMCPIIVCDGIIPLDIIYTFSENLPPEIFFCSTPLKSIATTVLSDYLKVQCKHINFVQVWAANDRVFHVEVEKPYLRDDALDINNKEFCDWNGMGTERMNKLELDHTQFNASFMKKEYIEMILSRATKNPYGCVYKTDEMAKTLRYIWTTRQSGESNKTSLGVISDGSVGTIKGLPYVLPLIFENGKCTVNELNWERSHVRREIQRINDTAKGCHEKLVTYCKKFVKEHLSGEDLGNNTPSSSSSIFYNF